MQERLFSELGRLYQTSREKSNVIRMELRLRDPVDGATLRRAVDRTMERYPYFAVRLWREGEAWYFLENKNPLPLTHGMQGVPLNSQASGHHLLAFGWQEDVFFADVFHALTDGAGLQTLLRTLLYYYCTERYKLSLSSRGIRLAGEPIPLEEWEDPAAMLPEAPAGEGRRVAPALNLTELPYAKADRGKRVFGITVEEDVFMDFCRGHDGSPGTMTALLLSRAIASLHPDSPKPVRICLCVNQRPALKAPLAHQSLVGWAWLEYKERLRAWPLTRQATAFRGMVFAQTLEEQVLANQQAMNRNCRAIQALKSDEARAALVRRDDDYLASVLTATVSYVGKGNFGDAETFITGCRTLAYPMVEGILVELSAVNRSISMDFMQNFASPVYVEAFLRLLTENGVPHRFQGGAPLELPGVELPWL